MHMLKTYLVEDSAVIRQSLITTLEELSDVKVIGTAEDEASAVAWLGDTNNMVDLVIIDIFLKGGSGLGVLRSVNAMALGCNLVVLTNYATVDMRRKCIELGARRVFDKSNDIDALIHFCEKLSSGDPDTTSPALLQ
jgi:DNA-binding NarL/FixJ family response regulator